LKAACRLTDALDESNWSDSFSRNFTDDLSFSRFGVFFSSDSIKPTPQYLEYLGEYSQLAEKPNFLLKQPKRFFAGICEVIKQSLVFQAGAVSVLGTIWSPQLRLLLFSSFEKPDFLLSAAVP